MASLISEQEQFEGEDGKPIVNGYIYIGSQNLDAKLNPITIYSDRGLITALANPQRTDAYGRSVNKIWVPGKYSIKVEDSANVQKLNDLDRGEKAQIGNTILGDVQGVDALTATASPAITTLVDGQTYILTATANNTGPMTLKIDSTTAYPIKKNHDVALGANDVEADQIMVVVWNATDSAYELTSNVTTNTFTSTVKFSKGADIASAAALTLGNDGNYFDVTGTTTITSIVTTGVGTIIKLHFDAELTLTHHATDLFLPGEVNITTSAGDEAEFVEYATGDWRCVKYQRNRASPSVSTIATTSGTEHDFTSIPSWARVITVMFSGVSTDGVSALLLQIGDSGGIETSGYAGSSSTLEPAATVNGHTVGFRLHGLGANAASYVYHGEITLTLIDEASFTWVASGNVGESSAAKMNATAGSKSLTAALDRIRLTTAGGTDAFDAGFLGLYYR